MMIRMLAFVALSAPAAALAQTPLDVHRVAWLAGCWEAASAAGSIEEQWMAPRGGTMVGMSRTILEDTLAGHELVVIREGGDRLVYQAHPSGQASAEFVAHTVARDSVVFGNPSHDFPKRIGYRRAGDRLFAWIEGAQTGEDRVEFAYRRVPCGGG